MPKPINPFFPQIDRTPETAPMLDAVASADDVAGPTVDMEIQDCLVTLESHGATREDALRQVREWYGDGAAVAATPPGQ